MILLWFHLFLSSYQTCDLELEKNLKQILELCVGCGILNLSLELYYFPKLTTLAGVGGIYD